MLQKTKMVVRKNLEKLYDCTCDVIEYKEIQKENKSYGFDEVKVFENQPCKISFESISKINSVDDNGSNVPLSVKLFISPDIKISTGSKIIVTQRNTLITEYKSSGKPATYDTHQEIVLELFKGWS